MGGFQEVPPPPPRYNIVGQYSGPYLDESSQTWKISLPVEADGSIDMDDELGYDQARHLGHSHK